MYLFVRSVSTCFLSFFVRVLQDGDWLILGSDGLYDNMYDAELVEIVVREGVLTVF